jgi:arylsulfatase A-like enzyme/Tfp pilus assembly protein PilF
MLESFGFSRRRVLAFAGFWILFCAGAYVLFVKRAAPQLPAAALRGFNVLLITVDTLRADRLGSYGSSAGLTPALDRLASRGFRFETVHAHVPLTLPSHASIFTGRYPFQHGVHDNGSFRLNVSEQTLASSLQRAGYRTGAFVSAFVLDSRFGLDRGFDIYDDDYGTSRSGTRPPSAFEVVERRADAVVKPAERWIEDIPPGAPWFAWVHLYDPHAPYEAPSEFRAKHADDPYAAEVAYVDSVLGKFFERLGGAGALERTCIVVTSDHGESLGEHGEMRHGVFAYESTLLVPWILWAPGLGPRVFPAPVRHVDLMPTLLDLIGVPAPKDIEGESLRPYLAGELPREPSSSYFEALNTNLTRDWAPLRGLIRNGYKLIDLPIAELYDLGRDPDEQENLYDREKPLASELRRELSAMSAGHALSPVSPLEDESAARLRTLGYLTAPAASRKEQYSEDEDPKRLIGLTNLYEEGVESFRAGDMAKALEALRGLVSRDEGSAEAHLALAYVLHESGQPLEAISILEKAIERPIESVGLVRLLGIYLLEVGELRRAMPYLEKAVRQDPLSVEARNFLAVAYSSQGRPEEARSELNAVLDADPRSTDARVNLGTLELSLGRFDEAIREFQRALEQDSSLSGALNGMGAAYFRKGDIEASLASWRRAVESDPNQFDALFNLGTTLAAHRPTEAVPVLERFVAEAPAELYASDIAEAQQLLEEIHGASPRP